MQTGTLKAHSQKENAHSAEEHALATDSKKLAGLIGPVIIALAITETINLQIWAVSQAPVIYLNGTLLFIAGLSIIRRHNRWRGWPMLITLTGWVAFSGGLYRMLVPGARQAGDNVFTYIMFGVLLIVGLYLTYKAYLWKKGMPIPEDRSGRTELHRQESINL